MPVRNSRPCPREGNYRRDCLWSLRWYFRHAVNNQLCRLNIAFSLWTIWLISSPIYQCGRKMETINKCVCGNVRPRQSISSTVLTHSSAYRSLTLLGWNCCWLKKRRCFNFMSASVWLFDSLIVNSTPFWIVVLPNFIWKSQTVISPPFSLWWRTPLKGVAVDCMYWRSMAQWVKECWHFIDPPGGRGPSPKMDGQATLPKH